MTKFNPEKHRRSGLHTRHIQIGLLRAFVDKTDPTIAELFEVAKQISATGTKLAELVEFKAVARVDVKPIKNGKSRTPPKGKKKFALHHSKILEYVGKNPNSTAEKIRAGLHVEHEHRNDLRNILAKLARDGHLKKKGKARATNYSAASASAS